MHRHPSKYFRWLGHGALVKTLEPYASAAIELSVAILGPGTYDLGAHVQVLCRKLNQTDESVPQTNRLESAIIITNSADE